ncbi:hypothetical protein [Actinocorallia sp. A-T 12471]|uniref:hypothetical protein n=1 Tax=Actinocorallia sp. A-T 12471 TaxID=3089813 RepID=UPI0029CC006F|nr:hypothetical protein [Actinocorallia sp. A-T 12471]MDX6743695.1 hypothetical protein [Actinocorallia sp. A-T 12471]
MTSTEPTAFTGRLRDAFSALFRKRGYVVALVCALALTAFLGPALAWTDRSVCSEGEVETPCPQAPRGPDGSSVTDSFAFAHRTLHGDGSLTARLASFTGTITYPPPNHDRLVTGLVPWAKTGLLVKASLEPGADYAAVLLTGDHGVRFQHGFSGDEAGSPTRSDQARWLRLTREGDVVTGEESADGVSWHPVGSARLPGLPTDVPIGVFAASPGDLTVVESGFGPSTSQVRFTQAVGAFDAVTPVGDLTPAWASTLVGDDGNRTDWERHHNPPGLLETPTTLKISGSGDIAPVPSLPARRLESLLLGGPLTLTLLIALAASFIRPHSRTTDATAGATGDAETAYDAVAGGRTGAGVVARVSVVGVVGFVVGVVGAGVAVWAGPALLAGSGVALGAVPVGTEVRVVAGVGVVCAAAAVFGGCLAMLLGGRWRGAAVGVALLPVPYLLAVAGVLPDAVADWMLRLTPAAGMAAQQSVTAYPQVTALYTPANGYLPLPPWAGLAVLLGFVGLAFALARRRARGSGAA